MLTTNQKRKVLEQYRDFHREAPRMGSLWRKSLKAHLVLLALLLLVVPITWFLEIPSIGLFTVGLTAGAILRDSAWFRRSVQFWPLLDSIIDWNKVDTLLEQETMAEETQTRSPIPSPGTE